MSARVVCDCGWVSSPMTPAHARRIAHAHRCESVARREAQKERGKAAREADGPRRDCTHPQVRHEHGTRLAYVRDRCRCRACRDANRVAESKRTRLKAYGLWDPLADAEPVRAHVRALMATGVGWQRIAAHAGVSNGGMTKLLYGTGGKPPSRRIRHDAATRLLAVQPGDIPLAGGATVDGTGTRRRIQALAAAGWTHTEVAARIGWTVQNLTGMARGGRRVSVRTAAAVAAVYEELWDKPGPSTRARLMAERRGWFPSMAWDDIDDQAETPDRSVLRPAGPATGRKLNHGDDVRWLLAQGETHAAIAARLGISEAAVDRHRYGRAV